MRYVVRVVYKFIGLSPIDHGKLFSGLRQAGCLENSGKGLARHKNWGALGPGKGECQVLEAWLSGAALAQNQSGRGEGGAWLISRVPSLQMKGTSFTCK